jgi:hypothetical protein
MKTTPPSRQATRQDLLDQIASITTMQAGTLAEEWRERPGPDGETTVRLGPYYKHQVWQDGRNVSRRIPAAEAFQLREDIDNARRFGQLTSELARINIEHTMELRASQTDAPRNSEVKKNSKPKPAKNASRKPKPSSPKPKRP